MSTPSKELVPFVASQVEDYSIILSTEAVTVRTLAIQSAALVTEVKTPEDQKTAAEIIAELKGFKRGVEKAHEFFKKPHLERGRLVDSTARTAVELVLPEIERLEGLVAAYIKAERDKAERLRQEAEAERARLQKIEDEKAAKALAEQREKERIAAAALAEAEAEKKRLQEQAAAATSADELRAAQAEIARIEQEQVERELAEEFNQPIPVAAPVFIQRAAVAAITHTGGSFKQTWDFEVTDPAAFYKALPHFCEITIKRSFLLDHLNSAGIKPENIPGIRAFKKEKFSGKVGKR